jgi:uncharacterized Zn-binding protein involved in type VI secretion
MKKPFSLNDTSSSSEGNDPEATSRSTLKATVEVAMRSDELTSNQSPLAPGGDSVAAHKKSGSPPNAVPSYVLRDRIEGFGSNTVEVAMRSDEMTTNQSPLAPAGDSVAADIESASPPNAVRSDTYRDRIVGIEGGSPRYYREREVGPTSDCDCDDLQSHPRRYAICFAIFLLFFIVMIIVFRSICDGDECDRNP